MAEVTARWIRSGAAGRMVNWKRKEAQARRKLLDRHLGDFPTDSHPDSAHVWLPLPAPWRSEDFAAQARRRGVSLAPAEIFVVGRASAPHAVRLSLSTPPARRECEKGLEILADVLSNPPDVCCSAVV